jgi:hypothetical protein
MKLSRILELSGVKWPTIVSASTAKDGGIDRDKATRMVDPKGWLPATKRKTKVFKEYLEAVIQESVTPEHIKEVGDCAIYAMSKVTGFDWQQVYDVAKDEYRNGLVPGAISRAMRELGWNMEHCHMLINLTVFQAEKYMRAHFPDRKFICTINVRGVPHAIPFVDGIFHNKPPEIKKAIIRDANECTKV